MESGKKLNSFFKTYLLILVPIAIILIFVAVIIVTFSRNYRKIIRESYTSSLTMVCDRAEDNVNNITNVIKMLALDDDFMNVLTKPEGDVTQKDIYEATQTLNSIKDKTAGIDSAFIINRVQQTEYGTMGTYQLGEFFDDVYKYSDYSYSYWKYYQAPVTDMQILPPSTVIKFAGNENVIPIVYTHIENRYLQSLLIVNIKAADLFDRLEKNKVTDNSFFYIVNKQLKKAYSRSSVADPEPDAEFFEKAIREADSEFAETLAGERYTVFSHSPYSSALGYAYVAFVPERDIRRITLGVILSVGIIGLVVLAAVLFMIRVSVREIYRPIEKITENISGEKDAKKKDPLTRLSDAIDSIQSEKSALQMKIESSLPLIQERNIIALLNQNEHYADSIPEVLFEETVTGFKYDMFCAVIISMSPTEKFYTEYSDNEYVTIYGGLRTVVKNMFGEKYDAYMIPCEVTDAMYILLNVPQDTKKSDVLKILDNISGLLATDSEYVTVSAACGGIYGGIRGMRKSHREAMKEITGKTNMEGMQIEIIRENRESMPVFGERERTSLADALISGDFSGAAECIKGIVLKNLRNNVSDESMARIFGGIAEIMLHIIKSKEIDYEIQSDEEFLRGMSECDADRFLEKTEEMARLIAKNTSDKLDIRAAALWVDFHFREDDCGVEKAAGFFGTSAKYISQKFKDVAGMNFTEYLAKKRVEYAKELLDTTTKSIAEVGEAAGYPIKSTFIRAFKKVEGISPSEYREGK